MGEVVEKILELNNVSYSIFNAPTAKHYSNAGGFLKAKSSPSYLANDINNSKNAVGATIYIVDERYKIKYATNLFYLTSFSFALKERTQVTNSLKEPIVSFFDESVKVYTFNGASPEAGSTDNSVTYSNFQHSSIVHLYNNHLRGTELVKNKHIAVLRVGNHVVYGYPLNLNSSLNSGQDKIATFSMNWAIAKHTLDLPGTVSKQNLESMSKVEGEEGSLGGVTNQDLNVLKDYLDKYVTAYRFAIAQSDAYLTNVLKVSDLSDLAQSISDIYEQLVASGVIVHYELFTLSLTQSIDLVTTAKTSGWWLEVQDDAENAINSIAQYKKDIEEGRGLVNEQNNVGSFKGEQLNQIIDYSNSLPKMSQYTKI